MIIELAEINSRYRVMFEVLVHPVKCECTYSFCCYSATSEEIFREDALKTLMGSF